MGATAARDLASGRTAPLGRLLGTALVLVVAIGASLAVAAANSAWFSALDAVVHATDPVVRGLLFSSWLLVVGIPVVVRRPAAFGLRIGDPRAEAPVVVLTILAAVVGTVAILRLTGATPYSDASLLIEAVDVPVTEALVFRAVS